MTVVFCAVDLQHVYLTDIVVEGMVGELVKALKSDHDVLIRNSARAIFKVA